MKVRRAVVSDTMVGVLFIVVGLVAFVIAWTRGELEFDSFAAWLAGMFVCAVVLVVAVSVQQLRRAATLPESVTLLRWYSVAWRLGLSAAVPVASIVFLALSPAGESWVLGVGCVILGVGMCGTAALAVRCERRHQTRVFRWDRGYFLGR